MKNSTYAQGILLTILFLFCSFSYNFTDDTNCKDASFEEDLALSTVRICRVKQNASILPDCQTGSWELHIVSECEAYISGEIFATNLHPNPDTGVVYSLPGYCPSLYLQYTTTIAGEMMTDELNDQFQFYGDTHLGLDGLMYDLFSVKITIPIEIGDQCGDGPFASIAVVPINIAIVTNGPGQGYVLYPVDNFALPYQPYSCKVFAETCSECPENHCGKDVDPVFNGTACGECSEAACEGYSLVANEDTEMSTTKEKESTMEQNLAPQDKYLIHPNPFSDNFMIQNQTETSSDVNISIFDTNGNIVYQANAKNIAGKQSLEITNLNLNPGVYYCKINTPTESLTKKIVKLR